MPYLTDDQIEEAVDMPPNGGVQLPRALQQASQNRTISRPKRSAATMGSAARAVVWVASRMRRPKQHSTTCSTPGVRLGSRASGITPCITGFDLEPRAPGSTFRVTSNLHNEPSRHARTTSLEHHEPSFHACTTGFYTPSWHNAPSRSGIRHIQNEKEWQLRC